MSRDFYATLPLFTRFEALTRTENYSPVPDDWIVLIADVVGSTAAIESGRYKDVNVVGASCIMAVLNAAEKLDIPYVFGGDGASLAIPPEFAIPAREALRGTRRLARESFNLELLIGAVPVADIRAAGKELRIAKFGATMSYAQAMFTGGGVAEAERMVKNPDTRGLYAIPDDDEIAEANFGGLECRWQGIKARGGETISLLVQVHAQAASRMSEILEAVLADILDIYGEGSQAQPVSSAQLNLCTSNDCIAPEVSVHSLGHGRLYRYLLEKQLRLQTWIGRVLMDLKIRAAGVAWGRYKEDVAANTDYRKFDDTLRMVLDSTAEQRARLESRLEERRQRREIVYGIHVAMEALMTCLIIDRGKAHTHFVDGANGGYALAARQLKAQLAEA
jgi:hypothetical protein